MSTPIDATSDQQVAERRYEELDRSYGRAGDAVVVGLFVLTVIWRQEGPAVMVGGTLPLISHLWRRMFVRSRSELFRWAKRSTLVSAAAVVLSSLGTGGLWSPVLVFSLLLSVIAITAFPNQRSWMYLAPGCYAVVATASPWIDRPDGSSWFGPICIATVAVAVPRFVSDFVVVEMEQRSRAVVDPLTGCLNRASLGMRSLELEQSALATGRELGVVMMDIDHFKRVNDTHGHSVGDDVLVEVAKVAQDVCDGVGTVFRVGGEEFLVLVPDADAGAARRLGRELCDAVRQREFVVGTITVSVGVASSASSPSVGVLAQEADAALLTAKREGRDQMVASASL